ncbi:MAG: hypothetical protein A2148_08170 [Chloroflexi bacterium RBG_16_68_14]|nr:MAG: hypothetical protein A2148_08170 [Chloroflexi bacterium RBG_16_68_14]
MARYGALLLGIAAWLGVAIVAVLVVNAWGDDNQVLTVIPIGAAVALAWLVGEWVTEHVFVPKGGEEVRHGDL